MLNQSKILRLWNTSELLSKYKLNPEVKFKYTLQSVIVTKVLFCWVNHIFREAELFHYLPTSYYCHYIFCCCSFLCKIQVCTLHLYSESKLLLSLDTCQHWYSFQAVKHYFEINIGKLVKCCQPCHLC